MSRLGPASGSPLQGLWPGKVAQLPGWGHSGASGGDSGEMGLLCQGPPRPGASPGSSLSGTRGAADLPGHRGHRQDGPAWAEPWTPGLCPHPNCPWDKRSQPHSNCGADGWGQAVPSLWEARSRGDSPPLRAGSTDPDTPGSQGPGVLPRQVGDSRNEKFLHVVDDLFAHHDDQQLLGQLDEAAPSGTLQQQGPRSAWGRDWPHVPSCLMLPWGPCSGHLAGCTDPPPECTPAPHSLPGPAGGLYANDQGQCYMTPPFSFGGPCGVTWG